MLKINNVSSKIHVTQSDKIFGFKFNFCNGLNIITGENSSGKSSILSCIYYNLGMEQLLGMSTAKSSLLDKCITSEFTYKNHTYTVSQSTVFLEIENSKGDVALLQREAVCHNPADKNKIKIDQDGKLQTFFLHAKQDHTNKRGFYNWLQLFLDIDLPKDVETNKNSLYLQNVFSGCFIEQTKGWSDFMAQMPSFNIKYAKRKLVEYLLSLECLEFDIEKDDLKSKRDVLIERWDMEMKNFERLDYSLSYKANGLNQKFEKHKIDSLKNLSLKVNVESEWLNIELVKRNTQDKLNKLRKQNREVEKRKDLTEQNSRRKDLKIRLLKLNRVKASLDRAYSTEKFKVESYKQHLTRLHEERSNIVGAKKVGELLTELSDSESCPLCDSDINIEFLNHEISRSDYENSLAFIGSKISMISSYLDSFSSFEEDYFKNCNYYESLILETKTEISNIDRDLNSSFDKDLYRSQVHAELINTNFLESISYLDTEFDKFKESINKINTDIINIDLAIRDISKQSSNDEIKIGMLQSKFRKYLKQFHYTSNYINKVNIRDNAPHKIFPSVFNASAGSHQSIRLASSASDFIRAEWAFYLALMSESKVHPGILIFDEPGQHAMSVESMKALLKASEKLNNYQLIYAISKVNKGYDEDKIEHDITIKELTQDLVNYNKIEIDADGHKLVSEI
ncbi:hypothetical protein [Aliidiomarina soli]|uniref:Rad50/SbcC-type AAA domain-containing protein n=1 Tax=Aliidiomarina soli TaxID=1928574 RepID=A0A432WHP4_9GAMM|nr:hypothetical protein [Aliidiomarina soli]RUO33320.1 hypothetical protein CWE14_08890 [Aliidiomarina soli]